MWKGRAGAWKAGLLAGSKVAAVPLARSVESCGREEGEPESSAPTGTRPARKLCTVCSTMVSLGELPAAADAWRAGPSGSAGRARWADGGGPRAGTGAEGVRAPLIRTLALLRRSHTDLAQVSPHGGVQGARVGGEEQRRVWGPSRAVRRGVGGSMPSSRPCPRPGSLSGGCAEESGLAGGTGGGGGRGASAWLLR